MRLRHTIQEGANKLCLPCPILGRELCATYCTLSANLVNEPPLSKMNPLTQRGFTCITIRGICHKKPWNSTFHGFFATFSRKLWACSSGVSKLLSQNVPPVRSHPSSFLLWWYPPSPFLVGKKQNLTTETRHSHPSNVYKTVRISFVKNSYKLVFMPGL